MNRRRFIQTAATAAMAVKARPLWARGTKRIVIVGAGIVGASIGYHHRKTRRPGNHSRERNAGQRRNRQVLRLSQCVAQTAAFLLRFEFFGN